MSSTSDVKIQNLLDAVTSALQQDDNLEQVIEQHQVSREEVDTLIAVIRKLHKTLVGVEPSAKFATRLQNDLMGTRTWGVVTTVRHLPARVHIAAVLTVVAGFILLIRRRLIDDATTDITEEPATI